MSTLTWVDIACPLWTQKNRTDLGKPEVNLARVTASNWMADGRTGLSLLAFSLDSTVELQARRGLPKKPALIRWLQPVAESYTRCKIYRRKRGCQPANSSRCRLILSGTKTAIALDVKACLESRAGRQAPAVEFLTAPKVTITVHPHMRRYPCRSILFLMILRPGTRSRCGSNRRDRTALPDGPASILKATVANSHSISEPTTLCFGKAVKPRWRRLKRGRASRAIWSGGPIGPPTLGASISARYSMTGKPQGHDA